MDLQARVADLIAAPKARWALAWLAAQPADEPQPVDFHDASTARPRATRLHPLRDNPAGLLAEVHTRVEDWRYQRQCHAAADHDTHRHISDDNRRPAELAPVTQHPPAASDRRLGPPDGYRRIATALATASAAAWWWQSPTAQPQTWLCTDPRIQHGRGLPFRTSYAHHWDATAPAAAMTTSTRLPALPAVALLADQNQPPPLRTDPATLSAWSVPIKPDARVAEIHSPADWISLVTRYPSHRTDLNPAPHLRATWPANAPVLSVDWHRLAQDYDGLHLSVAGWLTATSQIFPVPDRGYTVCDGWPTEATMWFRPVFTDELTRLQVEGLEYGYGRPVAGAPLDLTRATPAHRSWWQRMWNR